MMNCIIIEDQRLAQEVLQEYIGKSNVLKLVGTFIDIPSAEDFMSEQPVDLLFLDINLPKMSGMDFLRKEGKTPKTILTTAYSEFALECFEYNVIDYLLKPYSYERFLKAIQKTNSTDTNYNSKDIESHAIIYVKDGSGLIKLETKEILFIKSDGDYTEVITANKKHLTSLSLKEWAEKLNNGFVQVHRSYIVHMKHIQKVTNNKVRLGEEIIPIGRVYKSPFLELLKK